MEDKNLLDPEELHSSSTYPVCPPHLMQEAAELHLLSAGKRHEKPCVHCPPHLINIFTLKGTIYMFSNPCAGTSIYLNLNLCSKSHLSSRKHTSCLWWNKNWIIKNFYSNKLTAYLRTVTSVCRSYVWLFKHHLCTSNADDATLCVSSVLFVNIMHTEWQYSIATQCAL